MGKRQVGELEPSELVLSLIIADLASVPMQDFRIPLLSGLIPIFTLLALSMALSVLSMKSVRFRSLLCGRPSIIIEDGHLRQQEMARTRLTVDELLEELRGQGYTDLTQVKCAILETNGRLSVMPYASQQPPTIQQLGMQVEEGGLPLILISDGCVLDHNLQALGRDRNWLRHQLEQRDCPDPSQVFLFLCDRCDTVYMARKDPL